MCRRWFWFLCLWLGCLFLISPWDLVLSRNLTDGGNGFGRLINDWGQVPGWIGVALALFCLVTRNQMLPKPLAKCIVLQGLVQGLLVTHTLKQLRGRVRPSNISPDPIEYSPFYLPAGPLHGESFPSGHVAAAMMLAPIPFDFWRIGKPRTAALSLAVLLVYWISVAYGRIVFGVHFPTDCLFSIGFGLLLAALTTRYYSGRSRKS